jgi:hypothetical protein
MLKPGEYWAVLDKDGDIEDWEEYGDKFLAIGKSKVSEKHCVKVRIVRVRK